jgi:hypothetical protein
LVLRHHGCQLGAAHEGKASNRHEAWQWRKKGCCVPRRVIMRRLCDNIAV